MDEAQLAAVDAWLSESKTLEGLLRPWSEGFAGRYQARWGVLDNAGIENGELCFSISADFADKSISLMYRQRLVYRVDLVPDEEIKINPPWAKKYGLPPTINGSHTHPWLPNREYCRQNGFGELLCRSPTSESLTSLPQAFAMLADETNITITREQREIALPPQGALSLGGRRRS